MTLKLALIFDRTRPDTTGTYFERACQALGIPYDHFWVRDAARIPEGYACYLRIDHGDGYLTRLPEALRPAVFYAFETHLPHARRKIRRSAGWYDLVFCGLQEAMRGLPGSVWLPPACDPVLHAPAAGEPVWDVAFVGTEGGIPRKFYLQALRERYPSSFIGQAESTRLGTLYSQARVGFNYSITGDVNMRILEVLASRTLLVTNAAESPDLRAMGIEDRRHLVHYRRPREVFDLIEYYLAHPDERRRIAHEGWTLVRSRHTYVHRMQTVLAAVSDRLGVSIPSATPEPLSCAPS